MDYPNLVRMYLDCTKGMYEPSTIIVSKFKFAEILNSLEQVMNVPKKITWVCSYCRGSQGTGNIRCCYCGAPREKAEDRINEIRFMNARIVSGYIADTKIEFRGPHPANCKMYNLELV